MRQRFSGAMVFGPSREQKNPSLRFPEPAPIPLRVAGCVGARILAGWPTRDSGADRGCKPRGEQAVSGGIAARESAAGREDRHCDFGFADPPLAAGNRKALARRPQIPRLRRCRSWPGNRVAGGSGGAGARISCRQGPRCCRSGIALFAGRPREGRCPAISRPPFADPRNPCLCWGAISGIAVFMAGRSPFFSAAPAGGLA